MIIPPQRIKIDKEVFPLLEEIFENGQLAYGPYVRDFEEQWAERCNKKYAVMTNSCTSALEIAIRALKLPKGTDVVVPTNTYGASVQACWNAGHTVQLTDIERDLNMDIDDISWHNVGAVMFVGIGGNIPDRIEELSEVCEDAQIPLLLDSAHCHGNPLATEYGDVSCFSFYATKLMTTMGEGGCLVTDDPEIVNYARAYRHHGRTNHGMDWNHYMKGANMCMTEAQAIVGLSQLEHLDEFIDNRKKIAKVYNEKFSPIVNDMTNYYKYIVPGNPHIYSTDIRLPSPVYKKPIHQHSFWEWDYHKSPFPIADKVCGEHFCLPIFNDMTEEEATFVMDNVEVI